MMGLLVVLIIKMYRINKSYTSYIYYGVLNVKKKIMTIILSLTAIIALCNAANININSSGNINVSTIEDCKNCTGNEKRQIETKIIENIFNNLSRPDDLPLASTSELTITYGDVVGDSNNDAIFTVRIGPKRTTVVVYERINDEYKYKALVGDFFVVQELEVVEVTENEKNFIMIREHVNQMIGAYEESVFLRSYRWNINSQKFDLVLTIQEQYRAYWNELWDNNKPKDECHWLSVKQEGKITRRNGKYDRLYFKATQVHQISKQTNVVNKPEESDFETVTTREISQVYYWSDTWKNYIIGEGTQISTGQKVGILEDMSQQAASLIENDSRYRIKKSDGNIEYANKNTIKVD